MCYVIMPFAALSWSSVFLNFSNRNTPVEKHRWWSAAVEKLEVVECHSGALCLTLSTGYDVMCHAQFPALFSTYSALLAYMAEIHASRLCRLPDDLLHHLMAAVDLGLTSNAGPDVAKACLELVASLAAHVCTDATLHGSMAYQVGAHFLEVVFN